MLSILSVIYAVLAATM